RYVDQALFREKQAYYNQYVNKESNHPRTVWSHIKQHVRIKAKPELPGHMFADPDK
ncbi:hypothetical protein ABMA28_016495, partial [Loxostege sticticalis]